jgi:uncharacterized membrane protein
MAYWLERAAPVTQAEKRVMIVLGILVCLGVIISTVLHHAFPEILRVPGNADLPYASLPEMLAGDVAAMALSLVLFWHAWRHHGGFRAVAFLAGSFVFTGVEESMWIVGGRFSDFVDSYYFTRGFFWFIETPVSACLGWFIFAYGCMFMAEVLFTGAHVILRASIAAFLAMDVDLWMDPVMTRPEFRQWVWLDPDQVYLFSIPLLNFIGWFMLIFIFAIVYEYLPGMRERRGPARSAAGFFGILMVIEVGILLFFICYLMAMRRIFPEPVNLTLWGI